MQVTDLNFKAKLGKGTYATCYLMDDNKVMKLYHTMIQIRPLVNIKNDTYVFPYETLYDTNGNIIFSLMPFANGHSIAKRSISIETIIAGIDKIYHDTDLLSELGIIIDDINGKNILYSTEDNKFKIIDTDFFHINEYYSYSELKGININELNASFIRETINDSKDLDILMAKCDYLKKIYLLLKNTSDNRLLKEYLITLKQFLESRLSKDVVTLMDAKKAIKILGRR